MTDNQIFELINRRQRQILVHSCLYYLMDESIISDFTYDDWSKELALLMQNHPEIAAKTEFAESYKNFDGSTGYHLPFRSQYITALATQMLYMHKKSPNPDKATEKQAQKDIIELEIDKTETCGQLSLFE